MWTESVFFFFCLKMFLNRRVENFNKALSFFHGGFYVRSSATLWPFVQPLSDRWCQLWTQRWLLQLSRFFRTSAVKIFSNLTTHSHKAHIIYLKKKNMAVFANIDPPLIWVICSNVYTVSFTNSFSTSWPYQDEGVFGWRAVPNGLAEISRCQRKSAGERLWLFET